MRAKRSSGVNVGKQTKPDAIPGLLSIAVPLSLMATEKETLNESQSSSQWRLKGLGVA